MTLPCSVFIVKVKLVEPRGSLTCNGKLPTEPRESPFRGGRGRDPGLGDRRPGLQILLLFGTCVRHNSPNNLHPCCSFSNVCYLGAHLGARLSQGWGLHVLKGEVELPRCRGDDSEQHI